MDYEKKYKDALERARKSHDKANDLIKKEWIETIFPELKENEGEKIRKQILSFLKEFECDHYRNLDFSSWIAWLEKQGEQKSIDTITPKFKIGDWVILDNNHNSLYQIEKIENYQYFLRHFLGGAMPLNFCNENDLKLWTIEDAKYGDVLVNGSNIFKFHFIIGTRVRGYCHVNTDDGRFYNDIGDTECFGLIDDVFTPATKEQRDFLFQKMKEAGYNLNKED